MKINFIAAESNSNYCYNRVLVENAIGYVCNKATSRMSSIVPEIVHIRQRS